MTTNYNQVIAYLYMDTHDSLVAEYNLAWFLLQIHKIKAYCLAVVFKILVFTLWQLNAVRLYFTNTIVLHNLVQYIVQDDLKIYQYTP